jgi:hypothetical protein
MDTIFLMGIPEEKRPLGRYRVKWVNSIEMNCYDE